MQTEPVWHDAVLSHSSQDNFKSKFNFSIHLWRSLPKADDYGSGPMVSFSAEHFKSY